jgi:hypothetical protein
MDCRTFQQLLPRYLRGGLSAAEFDRMVEHEAGCAACRELAATMMSAEGDPRTPSRLREIESAWAGRDRAGEAPADTGRDWMAATLSRTVGADCNYIRQRLAEALDARPAADTAGRVKQHLEECADCRGMAAMMQALPEYYDALPHLRADQSFVREIIARTLPARLGWLAVLRALVRRPEALWEGAVVCAILAVPLAGPSMMSLIQSARETGTQVEQRVTAADPLSAAAQRIAIAGQNVRLTIAAGGQSIADSWTQTRARVRQSINDEINERAAADPRVAVVVPLVKDALTRIGVIEAASVQPEREETEENSDELR